MTDRPRCIGCDTVFNDVCRPATIMLWPGVPGASPVRLCSMCEEEVLLYSPRKAAPQTPPPQLNDD